MKATANEPKTILELIAHRWRALSGFAEIARRHTTLVRASFGLALIYNMIGCIDMITTLYGIRMAVAAEANPLMEFAMQHMNEAWIPLKFSLQLLATAMLLWFPHRFVLAIFSVSVSIQGLIVLNNMFLTGVL